MKKIGVIILICSLMFSSCGQLNRIETIKQKKMPVKIGVINEPSQVFISHCMKIIIENNTDYEVALEYFGEKLLMFTALDFGQIDICTIDGQTIYSDILGLKSDDALASNSDQICKDGLYEAFNTIVLEQIGYTNDDVLCMKSEYAQKYNIETVTNLLPYTDDFVLAADFNWLNSEKGQSKLVSKYGFSFAKTMAVEHNLAVDALTLDKADVIVTNRANSAISKFSLFIIEQDREENNKIGVYPLLNETFAVNFPEVKDSVRIISAKIDDETLQKHLSMIKEDKMSVNQACLTFLVGKGIIR
jgi:glycine betaine/choline ABC-type transport system substrate-binding protein